LTIPVRIKRSLLRTGLTPAAVILLSLATFLDAARAARPQDASATEPAKVGAEASPQLFATMCALYAAGFAPDSAALDSDPGFNTLRSQLLALDGPATVALRAFYRDHALADPAGTMSRYVTFALVVAPPPKFTFTLNHDALPPDALALEGFNEVLANFYQEAQLDQLWQRLQPSYDRVLSAVRQPLGNMVLLETGYLRELLRPNRRTFSVYVEPLVGGRTNVRNMGDRYAVVVNPGVDFSDDIRHAFLHFLLDPLPIRYSTNLKGVVPLYQAALRAPRLPVEFHNDFSAFVTECLVHAVELRIRRLRPPQLAAELNDADSDGYVLVRPLMRALDKFEASEPPMNAYFPDLIRSIDVGAEFTRVKTLAFAPASNNEDVVAASKKAPASGSFGLAPDVAVLLADGERRIAAQDAPGAAAAFGRVLKQAPNQPRAVYGLAVASILQGDGAHARELFEQVVSATSGTTSATDPLALAWSHIYLGRMNDLDGNREQAVQEYRAALAVDGAPEAARAAAQRGIAEAYQPAGAAPAPG
jgi:tetratricopeptide (TPR) repeat protein